jgi:hypothetical protein
VYLLADSLDSILAACEDLLAQDAAEPGNLLRLELAAITHVLQARRYVGEIEVQEPTLVDHCGLFAAGTVALDLERLRTGRSAQAQRPEPAPAPTSLRTDEFLIGGEMPLGLLAQLAGALLDALEARFVLYDDDKIEPHVDAFLENRSTA